MVDSLSGEGWAERLGILVLYKGRAGQSTVAERAVQTQRPLESKDGPFKYSAESSAAPGCEENIQAHRDTHRGLKRTDPGLPQDRRTACDPGWTAKPYNPQGFGKNTEGPCLSRGK